MIVFVKINDKDKINNKEKIEQFRNKYGLSNELFSDEKLNEILEKCKYNFEESFQLLIQ